MGRRAEDRARRGYRSGGVRVHLKLHPYASSARMERKRMERKVEVV